MAIFLLLGTLMLAMTGQARCAWCVCKDMPDAVLQKTLDYACGAGADCNPTHSNGPCFQPNTVRAHCSYAVNSYFQRKGQAQGACDFSGTATLSPSDPSSNGCSFPSTASATPVPVITNNPTKGGTTTTVPNTNPTSNTNTNNPYSNGVGVGVGGGGGGGGGLGSGVGPTGAGGGGIPDMSDTSASIFTPPISSSSSLTLAIIFLGAHFYVGGLFNIY